VTCSTCHGTRQHVGPISGATFRCPACGWALCGHCLGEGQIRRATDGDGWEWDPCGPCGGRGLVPSESAAAVKENE
jgi:DnaJ-class molecular chaperone